MLRGALIAKIGHERYRFKDATGEIDVEIDDKDLPAHQNVGQIRDAEAAVFALQLVEPIVHIGCLQRIVFRYR